MARFYWEKRDAYALSQKNAVQKSNQGVALKKKKKKKKKKKVNKLKKKKKKKKKMLFSQ